MKRRIYRSYRTPGYRRRLDADEDAFHAEQLKKRETTRTQADGSAAASDKTKPDETKQ